MTLQRLFKDLFLEANPVTWLDLRRQWEKLVGIFDNTLKHRSAEVRCFEKGLLEVIGH
jgi:hypothetical protein